MSRHANRIHFPNRTMHIIVWMHEVFLERCVGVYVPRLGGWAW